MVHIRLIHCDDGLDLVDTIRQKLQASGFQVDCHLLKRALSITNPSASVFSVLFVTPMVGPEIKNIKETDFKAIFPIIGQSLAMYYESGEDELESRRTIQKMYGSSELEQVTVSEDTDVAVKIIKEKANSVKRPARTPSRPGLRKFIVHPSTVSAETDEIMVIFLTNEYVKAGDEVSVRLFANMTTQSGVKKGIKEVWSFSVKGWPEGNNGLEVLINGTVAGQCTVEVLGKMDTLAAILNDVTDPLQFILQALKCQSQHIPEELDQELSDILGRPNESYDRLFGELDCLENPSEGKSSKEFATILHFAAKLGLEKFCLNLKHHTGFKAAMKMKNSDNLSPAELAKKSGYCHLASKLEELDDGAEPLPSPVNDKNFSPPLNYNTHPLRRSSDRWPSNDSSYGSDGSAGCANALRASLPGTISRNCPGQISVMSKNLKDDPSPFLHNWQRKDRHYEEIRDETKPWSPIRNHHYDQPWTEHADLPIAESDDQTTQL